MAIRRTKESKQQAQLKRDQGLTYSWSDKKPSKHSVKLTPATLVTKPDSTAVHTVLGYSPKFIYQDLLKTAVVMALCIGVLIILKVFIF